MGRSTTRLLGAVVALGCATTMAAPATAAADTTAPVIDAVTFSPSMPTVYSAVAFSATAHDTESAIASVSWSFGDGGTALGSNVSHTYTQSGSMTVTVGTCWPFLAGNASSSLPPK